MNSLRLKKTFPHGFCTVSCGLMWDQCGPTFSCMKPQKLCLDEKGVVGLVEDRPEVFV